MEPSNDRKLITLLFNPFIYIAGVEAMGLGLAAILSAGLVGSWSNTHFDGVLDTHTGLHIPLQVFLPEGLADWVCLGAVLWVFGKIISRTAFRTLDLLGTQALARWPTLFIGLISLLPAYERFGHQLLEMVTKPSTRIEINPGDAILFFTAVLVMLALLCWMVALMYKAYSVSCNVKGAKAIGSFIAGLLIAEILSKIAIHWLLKLA